VSAWELNYWMRIFKAMEPTELDGLSHLKREFIAGGAAGSIGIFLGFPFDLIKVKLQAFPTKYKSAYQCLVQSIKQEGFIGLYNGFLPPVLLQGEASIRVLPCISLIRRKYFLLSLFS
jgi:hypothetical protein